MTTIAKLFADAHLGVIGISASTDYFTDLDIAGETFHGSLIIARRAQGRGPTFRGRRRIWNCVINVRHDTRTILVVYSAQGADADEALNKVEKKMRERASWLAGMLV